VLSPSKDASGANLRSELVFLESISLGGYEVHDVPTWRNLPSEGSVATDSNAALTEGVVMLGNQTFEHAILTVDYQRSQIILRDPSLFTTARSDAAGRTVKKIRRVDPVMWGSAGGFVAIDGKVAGRRTRVLIDTGLAPGGLALLRPFARDARLAPTGHVEAITGTGMHKLPYVDAVTWSIGDRERTTYAVITSLEIGDHQAGVGALIGVELLKRYRVTVDYTRNRLILEDYARRR
jgi:hypothetical protein